MNIRQNLVALPLIAASFCTVISSFGAAPFSDLDFEAASKLAAKSGKIVLVDFYTTWCGPCKLLDKNTWTDPGVIQLLDQKTVALRIDAEKETALAKRYKIEAYPSILFLKPDGTEIDRLLGYKEPDAFTTDFNAVLAGKDSIARARDVMTAAGTNNPNARMQFGRALAEKGRNKEALTEFLWCFDHGLESNSGFVGVRVSYLLSEIETLAAHYPPARQALETRRDETQAKVTAGTTEFRMVQDLIALNRTLRQEEKNLVMFDQLPVGGQIRELITPLLAEQLLKAKRYADVLGGRDGKAEFQKAVERFKPRLGSPGVDRQMKKRMEESIRQVTVRNGAQYLEALAGLKRNQEAGDLAVLILKFDSSETTRTSLTEAAQRVGNNELVQYLKQ